MKVYFTKMHGLGNDFVILDQRQAFYTFKSSTIQKICDRRLGIGCDQLITIHAPASSTADIMMKIYNADGHEVEACGNATRCIGFLLNQENQNTSHLIETKAGLLQSTRLSEDQVMVDLGQPRITWHDIPLTQEVDTLHMPIEFEGLKDPVAVSVGNPHLVFFVYDVESIDLEHVGKYLSHHPLFPSETNVEIVELIDSKTLKMRVYERGVGITPACGTGAAASVIAAKRRKLIQTPARVILEGGELLIDVQNTVQITGKVTLSFYGQLEVSSFEN